MGDTLFKNVEKVGFLKDLDIMLHGDEILKDVATECLSTLCFSLTEGLLHDTKICLYEGHNPLTAKETYANRIKDVEKKLSLKYDNNKVRNALREYLGDEEFKKYF